MKRNKFSLVIATGIMCCAGHIAAHADEPTPSTPREFTGHFQSGGMIFNGGEYRMVPIFMDASRPPVIKLVDDPKSDAILQDVCKPESVQRSAPAMARRMNQQRNQTIQGKSAEDMLHIAVFTLKSVPTGEPIKNPCRFEPGPIAKLDEIIKKHGKPFDQESWLLKEFTAWIGLHGMVSWWGSVGLATSADDTITHIFIREREEPAQSK